LPRGLGDDPLSKQRRNGGRKLPASTLAPSSSVAAPYDTPPVKAPVQIEPLTEAASFSSLSPTYNDIFFQRRPESPEDTPPTDSPTPGPSVAEPIAGPAESTQILTPTVPTGSSVPTEFPQLQGERDAALPQPLVVHNASPEPPEKKAVEPETEERGFFKRIFGKLRQH